MYEMTLKYLLYVLLIKTNFFEKHNFLVLLGYFLDSDLFVTDFRYPITLYVSRTRILGNRENLHFT